MAKGTERRTATRCHEHDLALGPTGGCVLCRRGQTAPVTSPRFSAVMIAAGLGATILGGVAVLRLHAPRPLAAHATEESVPRGEAPQVPVGESSRPAAWPSAERDRAAAAFARDVPGDPGRQQAFAAPQANPSPARQSAAAEESPPAAEPEEEADVAADFEDPALVGDEGASSPVAVRRRVNDAPRDPAPVLVSRDPTSTPAHRSNTGKAGVSSHRRQGGAHH
jgi:hypothetical protein